MEGEIPGWVQLLGNLGGVGLLIWFLFTDRKTERARNDERDKSHAIELADKNKELIAARDAQITSLKEVLTVVANNNVMTATYGATFQKLLDLLKDVERLLEEVKSGQH